MLYKTNHITYSKSVMTGERAFLKTKSINTLKPWHELTFTDDYMFKLVLRKHPKLCQRLLETILQIKIRKIVFLEAELSLTTPRWR